jgi:oligopeptide transport system substrate-binding protein
MVMSLRIHRGLSVLLLVCFAACGGKEEGRVREGLNGTYYGGVLNVNESEELLGLFPLQITHVAAQRIGAQIFEGLVRFDLTDLSVKPGLAESWTVDPTGTVYTFKLRDDVSFHDDPCFPGGKGREVEADDVIACFTRLCTLMPGNEMFWLFQDRVLGANAQMAASVKGEALPGVSGLERVNDRTVRITLVSPWPGFLHVLAHHGCWIWPVEALERYGADVAWHPVGTGPFKVKSFRRGEALVLERNPEYWRTDAAGNRLPFLDAVRYTFLQDKDREYAEFAKGHLDLVLEPPLKNDATREDTDQVQVMSIPGFSVQYYAFNTRIPPFNDPLVRRAISLAIDRRALVDTVLGGGRARGGAAGLRRLSVRHGAAIGPCARFGTTSSRVGRLSWRGRTAHPVPAREQRRVRLHPGGRGGAGHAGARTGTACGQHGTAHRAAFRER